MPEPDRVALVMPVHNRRELTLRLLRSLSRADRTGLDLRVVVVDDGSTDGTGAAIRRDFPEVQIESGDGTLHYTAGTNRGLAAALRLDPRWLVAMNDDAIVHRDFLQRLVGCARAQPRAVVGALLLRWDLPHRVFQVAPVWSTWRGGWQMPQRLSAWDLPRRPFEVPFIVGNCVLYPVEAVRAAGLMDERRFPHSYADAAYTAGLGRAGWRLLVEPRALVWCQPNVYPPPLHTLPLAKVLEILLRDPRHPLNLRRQLGARWASAPSRSRALAAFAVHCGALGLKVLGIGRARAAADDGSRA
jgi:GT2 family glycosyltransferase